MINDLDGDVAAQTASEIGGETAVHAGDLTDPSAPRDARLGPIGGGTDKIMSEILGRTMGL